MQHSNLIGGSTAKRAINCPGSIALVQEVPRGGTSEYAELGTAFHEIMELLLAEKLELADVVGTTTSNDITITEEHYDTKIKPAWDAIQEVFDKYDVVEYMEESKVYFQRDPSVFGTTDVLAMTSDHRLLVIDFKFGDGIQVSPEGNYQLWFYAAAAYNTPELASFMSDVEALTFIIIQPGERFDVWGREWDVPHCSNKAEVHRQLDHFTGRVFTALSKHEAGDAEIQAGDWCGFCPAAPLCPQKTGAARRALAISPEQTAHLSEALQLADELENWIRAVRKLGHHQLENGFAVPGYKLVDKRATRKWADPELALDKVRRMKKIKLEDVTTTTLASPAQLEKFCKKNSIDFKQFADYIVSKSSGVTMVREDDPRDEASATLDQALAGLSAQL